jgi:hypothetical protein
MDPLHLIVQGVFILSASMYPIALFMGSSCFCTECDTCDSGTIIRCMRLKRWYDPSTFSYPANKAFSGHNTGFWISTSFPVAFTRPTQNTSSFALMGLHAKSVSSSSTAHRINFRNVYWAHNAKNGEYYDGRPTLRDDYNGNSYHDIVEGGHLGVSDFFSRAWIMPDPKLANLNLSAPRVSGPAFQFPAGTIAPPTTNDRWVGPTLRGSLTPNADQTAPLPLPLAISTGCLDTDRRTFKIDQVFGANWNTLSGEETQSYKLDWILCHGLGPETTQSERNPHLYGLRRSSRYVESPIYEHPVYSSNVEPQPAQTRDTLGNTYDIEKVTEHWTVKLKGWDFAPHPIGYLNKNYQIDWTILKVDGSSIRDNAESVFHLNFKGRSMGRSLAAPIELEVVGVQVVNNSRKGKIFATFGDGTKSVAESLKESISFRDTGGSAGFEEETFAGENLSDDDLYLKYFASGGRQGEPYRWYADYWVGQLPAMQLYDKHVPGTQDDYSPQHVIPVAELKTNEQYVDGKVRVDPEAVFPSDFDYSSTSENKRIFRYSVLEDEQEEIDFTIRYTLKVSVGDNSTHWLLDYNDTISSSEIEEYDPEQDSVQPVLIEGQDVVTPPDRPVEKEPPEPYVDYDARVATIYPRPSAFFLDVRYARDLPDKQLKTPADGPYDYDGTHYGYVPLDIDNPSVHMLEKTGDPVVKIEGVSCSQSKIKIFANKEAAIVTPAFSRNYYLSPYISESEKASWESGGNFRNFHNAGFWKDDWLFDDVADLDNGLSRKLPYGDIVSDPSNNTSNFDSGTPAYRPAIPCPVSINTEVSYYLTTDPNGSPGYARDQPHFINLKRDGMNYPGVFAELAQMYGFNEELVLHNTSMVSANWNESYRDQDAISRFAFSGEWTQFYNLYDGGIVDAKIESYSQLCGHNIDQAPESTLPSSLTLNPVRYVRSVEDGVETRADTALLMPQPVVLKRAGSTLINIDTDIRGGSFQHLLDFPPYMTDALSFLDGFWSNSYTSGEMRAHRLTSADFVSSSARVFADYFVHHSPRFQYTAPDGTNLNTGVALNTGEQYKNNDYNNYAHWNTDSSYSSFLGGREHQRSVLPDYEGQVLSMSVGAPAATGISNNSPTTYGTLADLIPFFDGIDPNVDVNFDMPLINTMVMYPLFLHHATGQRYYESRWRSGYGTFLPEQTAGNRTYPAGLQIAKYGPNDIYFSWKKFLGQEVNPCDWFAKKHTLTNLSMSSAEDQDLNFGDGPRTVYFDVMEVVTDVPEQTYYNGPTRPAFQTSVWVQTTYDGPFQSFGMEITPPEWFGEDLTDPYWIVNAGLSLGNVKRSFYMSCDGPNQGDAPFTSSPSTGQPYDLNNPDRGVLDCLFAGSSLYQRGDTPDAQFVSPRKYKYVTDPATIAALYNNTISEEQIQYHIEAGGVKYCTNDHEVLETGVTGGNAFFDSENYHDFLFAPNKPLGFGFYNGFDYSVTYRFKDLCPSVLSQNREEIRRSIEDVNCLFKTFVRGGASGSFSNLPDYLTPFGENVSDERIKIVYVMGEGGINDGAGYTTGYTSGYNPNLCNNTGGTTGGTGGTSSGPCLPTTEYTGSLRYYTFHRTNTWIAASMWPSDMQQYEPCGTIPVPPGGQPSGNSYVPCPTPPYINGQWNLTENTVTSHLITPGTISGGHTSHITSATATSEVTELPIPDHSSLCQSNYQSSAHGIECGSVMKVPWSFLHHGQLLYGIYGYYRSNHTSSFFGLHEINYDQTYYGSEGANHRVITVLDSETIDSVKSFVRSMKDAGPCFPEMHTSTATNLTTTKIPLGGPSENGIWNHSRHLSSGQYVSRIKIENTSDNAGQNIIPNRDSDLDISWLSQYFRQTKVCIPADMTIFQAGGIEGMYAKDLWTPRRLSHVATQVTVPHSGGGSVVSCLGAVGSATAPKVFVDVCRSFYHNSKNGTLKKDIEHIKGLTTPSNAYSFFARGGEDEMAGFYLNTVPARSRLTWDKSPGRPNDYGDALESYAPWKYFDLSRPEWQGHHLSYKAYLIKHSMQALGQVVNSATKFFNKFRDVEYQIFSSQSPSGPATLADNAPLLLYSGTYGIKGNIFLTGQPNSEVTIYLVPAQWMATSNVSRYAYGNYPHFYDNLTTAGTSDSGNAESYAVFTRSNQQKWDYHDRNYQQQAKILTGGTFTFDSNGQANCLIDLPRSDSFTIPSGAYLPCIHIAGTRRVPNGSLARDHMNRSWQYEDVRDIPQILRPSAFPNSGYEAQGTYCGSDGYGDAYSLIPLSSTVSGVQGDGLVEAVNFGPVFLTREEELIPSFDINGPDVNKIKKSFETFDTPHGITIRRKLGAEQDKYISTAVGGFKIEAYPKHPDGWTRYFNVPSILENEPFAKKFGHTNAQVTWEDYKIAAHYRAGTVDSDTPTFYDPVVPDLEDLRYSTRFLGPENNYKYTYEKWPEQDGMLSVEIASFNIDETTTPPSPVLDSHGVHEKGLTWFLSARSQSEYCKFPTFGSSGPYTGQGVFTTAKKGEGYYLEHEEEPLGLIDFTKDNNPDGLSSNSMKARGVLVAQIGRFNTTGRLASKEVQILQHEGVLRKPDRIYQGLAECSSGTNLEFFGDGPIENGKILQLKVRATDHHGGSSDWTYLADVKIDKELPHIQQVFIGGSLQPEPEEGQVSSEDIVTVSEQSPVDPLKFNELFPHASTEIDREKQIPKVMLFNRLDLQLPLKLYGYTKPDTEIYTGRARRITGEKCGEKLCTSDGTTDFATGSTGSGYFEYKPEGSHNTEKDWLTITNPPDPEVEGSVETIELNIPSNGTYKSYSFVSVSFAGAFTEKTITLLHKDPKWVSGTIEGDMAVIQVRDCQLGSDVTFDLFDLTAGNGTDPDYTKTVKGVGVGNTTGAISVVCSKVLTSVSATMTATFSREADPNAEDPADDPGTYFSISNVLPLGLNPSVGDRVHGTGIVDENGNEAYVTIASKDEESGLYILSLPLPSTASVQVVPLVATKVNATGKTPDGCPFILGQVVEGLGYSEEVTILAIDEDYPNVITLSTPLPNSGQPNSYFVTLKRQYSVTVYVKIAGTQVWTVSKGSDDVQVL